ncbi:MAG: flagellar motor protein MotB, partial [Pseudomonadota bacterium]
DAPPATEPLAPIIVKKITIEEGGGHHGGAWKVAYADFVTAMMAFFLLMWLLNATTEEQRKGIADYFNPTIPISRISGGGSDGLNGSSIFTEETYAKMGTGATRDATAGRPSTAKTSGSDLQDTENPSGAGEAELAEQLALAMQDEASALNDHIMVKMSPEGIVMELVDSEDVPLFQKGASEPTDLLITLVATVTTSFETFENSIKIVGHTDAHPFQGSGDFDNWDLSAARANVARRLLINEGFPAERIQEVSGRADTDLLVEDDPFGAQNRRISITLLKQE